MPKRFIKIFINKLNIIEITYLYMNQKEHLSKLNRKNKFIICLVGEPRVFLKSLKIRNKFFLRNKFINVESRYLINFNDNDLNNKDLIFKKLSYLKKDKYLKSIDLEKVNIKNLFRYFLEQKYKILKKIKHECLDRNFCVILTRSDWLFSQDCYDLIDYAIRKDKIVTPTVSQEIRTEIKNKVYTPFSSQFIVIPYNLLDDFLQIVEYAIKFHDKQILEISKKNLDKGGNGRNRFGLGDEALFGLAVSDLNYDYKIEARKFNYSFKPDMYGVINHNLIRDDAHIWMNLTINDMTKKFLNWYFKPLIAKKIKNFKKILIFKNYLKRNFLLIFINDLFKKFNK